MKVLISIQARTNSTRFPGKIYEKIGTKSLLEWIWSAAYSAHRQLNALKIDSLPIILGPASDETLKDFCRKEGMRALFPKAPEDDLLKRFKLAAFEEQATHIVRLTADCWEMPAQLIAEVVKLIEKRDYVSNTIRRTFPEGFDVQACSYRALEWFDVNQKEEREHPFKMFDLNEYNRVRFEKDGLSYTELLNPQLRFLIKGSSIDTKQDLEDARRWYAETQKADDRISRKSEDRARPGISGDEQQETHAVS